MASKSKQEIPSRRFVRRCYSPIDNGSTSTPHSIAFERKVDHPDPGTYLDDVVLNGVYIGDSITSALKGNDTRILMSGGSTAFSGTEVTIAAQYGYDRFQRAAMAHAALQGDVDVALDEEVTSLSTPASQENAAATSASVAASPLE